MFGNYLIGLREGLEASLVVCILIAYLVKTGRRDALRPIWTGIGVAVVLALGFGFGLEFGSQELTFEAQEALGGSLSILAVGLVTWMVFWMRRTARHLRSELHGKLDAALRMGTGALVATAFLAVGREGLETALFVWASVRASSDGTHAPLIGVLLGIATAVLLGWLFYRGALRINLARFFTWTGGMLVVVAAGVLAYGVHDLQEARFLGGLSDKAFDISTTVPPDSWYGTLLKGVLNFQPDPTVLQVTVWFLYLVPTLAVFLAPVGWRTVRTGLGRRTGPGRRQGTEAADEQAGKADAGDAPGSRPGGGGPRGGDGAVADGERVRDGARGAGGPAVGGPE
ncbi:iron uptake transporter permease EfeU [Streptomyces sp. NPDC050509]|uniref:iron uptake transporter permease EfeU n=1 Tax=Streptomyces sp. NPDC050509 TaxID=3365620 RepID=UPI00379988DC